MTQRLRLLAGLVLASLIVSLSAAQGLMRAPSEYGQMTLVICSGHGTETITIDSHGNPVSETPVCPDTTITATSGLPTITLAATLWSVTRIEPILPEPLRQTSRPSWSITPRAPPFLI